MRASTRAHSFLFLAVVCLATACMAPTQQDLDDQDPHQPGTEIGQFSVTGKLSDDSCGADSLNAPAKWSFDLKLSREGSVLYWLNGREAIVGDIDRSGRFSFESHVDVPLSQQRGATKGCVMVRRDSAEGTLKGSSSFSGKLSYAYDAKGDTDCSAYAIGTDGLPLALPCSLTYSLSASRVSQ